MKFIQNCENYKDVVKISRSKVVCASVCSIQISLGSIWSFMRVYVYCWDDKVREYSWSVLIFLLRILCVNTMFLATLGCLSMNTPEYLI